MSGLSVTEIENKALIRRWFEEVWNGGKVELIDELRGPGAVAAGLGESESHGNESFKAFYSNLRGAFPDLRVEIDDMLAEGDEVAVRVTFVGTHQGIALGAPPTGRKVSFGGIVIARIADGKIAQAWNSLDHLGMLKQVGAFPAGDLRESFLKPGP